MSTIYKTVQRKIVKKQGTVKNDAYVLVNIKHNVLLLCPRQLSVTNEIIKYSAIHH